MSPQLTEINRPTGAPDPAVAQARAALLGEADPDATDELPALLLPTIAMTAAAAAATSMDVAVPLADPLPAATPAPRSGTVASERTAPRARRRKHWLSSTGVLALLFGVLLYAGIAFPTERYISPHRGIGYALGIVGGSLMLLLLVYSARKRFRWLRFLGPTASWFRTHMLLGILGPLCILYHANFRLGAANSNVALFSMLAVSTSGLVGRYIYAHIHHGLYGSKLTLRELQQNAAQLRDSSAAFAYVPELMDRLAAAEARVLAVAPRLPLLGIAKLLLVGAVVAAARWRLHRYVGRTLRAAAHASADVAAQRRVLIRTANRYVDSRLQAVRRVAGFQAYERLFSLWHALHLPLIFILVAAAVVHVIAVNIY